MRLTSNYTISCQSGLIQTIPIMCTSKKNWPYKRHCRSTRNIKISGTNGKIRWVNHAGPRIAFRICTNAIKQEYCSDTTSTLLVADHQTITKSHRLLKLHNQDAKMRSHCKHLDRGVELYHRKLQKHLRTKTVSPNKHIAFLIYPSLLDIKTC